MPEDWPQIHGRWRMQRRRIFRVMRENEAQHIRGRSTNLTPDEHRALDRLSYRVFHRAWDDALNSPRLRTDHTVLWAPTVRLHLLAVCRNCTYPPSKALIRAIADDLAIPTGGTEEYHDASLPRREATAPPHL